MTTIRWACAVAALAALGLPPGLGAQQKPAAPAAPAAQDPATPAARFAAVKADHEKAMKVFEEAYQKAKNEEEQQKVFTAHYPMPESYVDRLLAIAKDSPKDPVAAECLLWVLENGRDDKQLATCLSGLLHDHLDSPSLTRACEVLEWGAVDDQIDFLRTVLDKSPHAEVRAQACCALGLRLVGAAAQAREVQAELSPERLQQVTAAYGAEWLAKVRKADAAALQKEGEAVLERLLAEFGSVATPRGTMGERAKAELFAVRNLAVGKPAPEIVGKDLDGVEFKLSDYRGKVVFLDFWGYW